MNGHLLARLQQGQLQQLLAGDGRDARIKREEQAIARLNGQLALAEQELENSSRVFKQSLKTGLIDPLFQEAVNEARDEVEAKKTAVTSAQQRLAGLRHEVDSKEFQAALKELFLAFANEEDTPKQRQAVNDLMRRAGLKVSLDREHQRVGMSIGDGDIDWQPLNPRLDVAALRQLMIDSKSIGFDIDLVMADRLKDLLPAVGEGLVDVRPFFESLGFDVGDQHALLDVGKSS